VVAAHVEVNSTGSGKVVQIFAHIPSQVGGPVQPRLQWTWAPWNQPDPEPVPSKLVKVLCEKLIQLDDLVNWIAMTTDGRKLLEEFAATNDTEEDDGSDLHPEDA
jgi:hypothetical protein